MTNLNHQKKIITPITHMLKITKLERKRKKKKKDQLKNKNLSKMLQNKNMISSDKHKI